MMTLFSTLSIFGALVAFFLPALQSDAQDFTIDSLSFTTNGARKVTITSRADSYYCLLRGDTPNTATNLIHLVLGDGAPRHLYDVSSQAAAAFYRVSQRPQNSSLDVDGDGMPDVWELTYGLNPLDPIDANADPDQDGYYNLAEYQLGTDPTVPTTFPGAGGLIINELDYDNIGTDYTEFIEIVNTSSIAIDLRDKAVVFINGAVSPPAEYLRVGLSNYSSDFLSPGQYLVVCDSGLQGVPTSALRINFPAAASNSIQNGAPDGVALINTTTGQVLDVLSYEGSITQAQITGLPAFVNLVEGNPLPLTVLDSNTVEGSLIRWPNATDSNDAAADWSFTLTPTPGVANVFH